VLSEILICWDLFLDKYAVIIVLTELEIVFLYLTCSRILRNFSIAIRKSLFV